MNLPLAVLAIVFLLIAVRRVGGLKLAIWQIVGAGALTVLLAGAIPPGAALAAIDLDVIGFLFGVFVVGEALIASGWLFHVSFRAVSRIRSGNLLLFVLLLASGLGSALLMNDTLAVIGTPLVLLLARAHRLPPRPLLLALAFGVTTGSVLSPIGNPQNLLIALGAGWPDPFAVFVAGLWAPTLLALLAAFAVLRAAYHSHFPSVPLDHCPVAVADHSLAQAARAGLWLLCAGVVTKSALALAAPAFAPRLTWIALAAALPVLLHRKRFAVVRAIDWHTLIFFAALFVLVESVWSTGVVASTLSDARLDATGMPTLFGVGVLLSQLFSNVPLVSLYVPLLTAAGAAEPAWLALAAASTIAGNLFILGAASNVIIVQSAERQGEHLGFFEFARVGIPLTAIQTGIYWAFLGTSG